jgi:hypothetical protein
MSTQPKTQPETWVPAGTEKREAGPAPLTEPQAERRKPRVAMPPPEERRRAPRFRHVRAHLTNLLWAALAAGVPWLWFLVRDLGTAAQVIALALPVLVAAAFVGLAISALDERKLSSLLVAVSVAAFGWVTILGPRSVQPAPPPVDPVRVASITLDGSNLDAGDLVATLVKQRTDLAVVVEPSKKARGALLRTDHYPFTLESGRFVVMSSVPIREIPFPKPLASALVARFEVDRPEGAFIVYAVRTNDSPLDAALNSPAGVERLRDSARAERLPVVLAGDFGIGDRSAAYRTLTDTFRDAMRSGARAANTAATFPWSLLFVRTSYVLTSPAWCAGPGATFDVDDAPTVGLTASVGPCRR